MEEKIWEGFNYEVFDIWDWKVKKRPRTENNLKIEQNSFDIHKKYLWDFLPDTEFIWEDWKIKEVIQTKVKWAEIIDLNSMTDDVKNQVNELLSRGLSMQEKHKILFDIFWMEWMIALFNHYFKNSTLKKISDFTLPFNSKVLEAIKKIPSEMMINLNNKEDNNPFLAYNLLKDIDWKVHFIDTDYRKVNIFHPLNFVWNLITKKALKDLENQEKITIRI